jgi:hypothetical protein
MKLTIQGHIYAQQNSWDTKPHFTFFDFEANDWVPVVAHEITIEVPDNFDIRPGMIAKLEKEKEDIKAAFAARITEINSHIQSLLAIENNAATV